MIIKRILHAAGSKIINPALHDIREESDKKSIENYRTDDYHEIAEINISFISYSIWICAEKQADDVPFVEARVWRIQPVHDKENAAAYQYYRQQPQYLLKPRARYRAVKA